MKKPSTKILIACLLVLALSLFLLVRFKDNTGADGPAGDREDLVIYSSHPIELISRIVEEFESRTGIRVTLVRGGTGEMIRKIDEEKEDPKADILWGGSLSTLTPHKALFADYRSANEPYLRPEFNNEDGKLTRFTDIPSVLMINEDLIGDIEINGYADLLQDDLKGKIAFCNPALSSSSFEHLINILYAMADGDDLGWAYLTKLLENLDGKLLTTSSQVYQGVADGEYLVGLTFEDAAASYLAKGDNIGIVYMEEGVVTTPDCVAVVKDGKHPSNAQKFVDFVTGYDAQSVISQKLHRRSVRQDVDLSPYLIDKDTIRQLTVDLEAINEHKIDWLDQFKRIFDQVSGGQDD